MKRGEIWRINLDPSIGAEIRKTRPALVVSIDAIGALPLRVVVPILAGKTTSLRPPGSSVWNRIRTTIWRRCQLPMHFN